MTLYQPLVSCNIKLITIRQLGSKIKNDAFGIDGGESVVAFYKTFIWRDKKKIWKPSCRAIVSSHKSNQVPFKYKTDISAYSLKNTNVHMHV